MTPDGALPTFAEQMFLSNATVRQYSRGDLIVRRDSRTSGFLGVLDGHVRYATEAGAAKYFSSLLGPRQWFGETILLDSHALPFRAVAADDCEIAAVSPRSFQKIIQSDTRALLAVTRLICVRQRQVLASAAGDDDGVVSSRLARRVIEASDTGTRMSQSDLADLIGVQRLKVNRLLMRWTQAGIVETGYGSVRVIDREALEEISASRRDAS
ncbi:hypothetical protein ABB26_09920 [Stenotrophomonas humi]|uniref:CRP-like protein Clp n=2 Tax=Stenotrophomonas humi TaxID=405444 RepID=A0A0R0CEZ4_9GAMM|nr:hypothetical protein ABB26_09920 [Stenotrophomonas humi]